MKDPRQRTLELGWTLNRAPEAIATDSPRHRPEEVSPEVVDVDAQSTISVSLTTAPLSCGLSDIGSSVSQVGKDSVGGLKRHCLRSVFGPSQKTACLRSLSSVGTYVLAVRYN